MRIIITENQIEFIRRYKKIKELVDNGIDTVYQQSDICDYTYSDFLAEVCWQVSDNGDELNMAYERIKDIDVIHRWVRNNFNKFIRDEFNRIIDDEKCNEGFDDVDEDYLKGLMFGADNIQESIDDKEYFKTLKITLSRRYDIIQQEMDHYMTNNLDCDEYPDDVEGFKDYILEKVTDEMMFTHNINKWEWSDLNDELNNMIGEQIKKTFKSWIRKHC
jgi:hypothetical protein